jgi:hypothetical protein
MENVGHHLIGGHEVVGVEGVNGTSLGLAERAGARYATQHEEGEVVGVDGRGTINKLTSFIVVIECMSHEMDVVSQGLTKALPEHEVVRVKESASEGLAAQSFTHDVPC